MIIVEEEGGKTTQYVAVRGTDNLRNIGIDLMARLVRDRKLKIWLHKGFKIASKAVYKRLKRALNKKDPIILTGHSLGGAIAFILGMYLKKDGYPVRQVVTYGQPKVFGIIGLKKNLNFPLFRVINRDDIVIRIPPIDPLLRIYLHVPKGIFLAPGNKVIPIHKMKRKKLDKKALKQLFERFKRVRDLSGINDHKIKSYIYSLEKRL